MLCALRVVQHLLAVCALWAHETMFKKLARVSSHSNTIISWCQHRLPLSRHNLPKHRCTARVLSSSAAGQRTAVLQFFFLLSCRYVSSVGLRLFQNTFCETPFWSQPYTAVRIPNARSSFTSRVDDIEDNSKLRRGVPVAHSIYGVASTINTANYVYFQASGLLARLLIHHPPPP